MSNYDMDEIERKRSQKQQEQWRTYVDESLEHPLNKTSKPSYVEVGNDQENIRRIHEDEEVTNPKHYDKLDKTIKVIRVINGIK